MSQTDLTWSQPSAGRREYELRSGAELVAALKFRSRFGTLATAESGDACWTFKRVGFWQSRASIRACGSETDLAVFTNQTWGNGGTLEFAGGRAFKATTNFWMTNFELLTDADEVLVRFKYGGVFRRSAEVEILPAAKGISEVSLLVLFGWYLVIMLDIDTAAQAGAVVATM